MPEDEFFSSDDELANNTPDELDFVDTKQRNSLKKLKWSKETGINKQIPEFPYDDERSYY